MFLFIIANALPFFCLCSLGPLVSKVKEYQVETIVDTLCTNMLSDKEQLRDISSIGLKTVIGELPPASSGKVFCIQDVFLVCSVTVLWNFGGLKNLVSHSDATLQEKNLCDRNIVITNGA